jgi:hypothetical protein
MRQKDETNSWSVVEKTVRDISGQVTIKADTQYKFSKGPQSTAPIHGALRILPPSANNGPSSCE